MQELVEKKDSDLKEQPFGRQCSNYLMKPHRQQPASVRVRLRPSVITGLTEFCNTGKRYPIGYEAVLQLDNGKTV